jgi:L-erythro-3,5-diaminohexanoate dehydrogenase
MKRLVGAKQNGQVSGARVQKTMPIPVLPSGDPYGCQRVLEPPGALPQPAWRLDADFSRLYEGETLLDVETLNVDAASFAQIEGAARAAAQDDAGVDAHIARTIAETVAARGKQHNPVTGSGGMLLGRVVQTSRAQTPGPGGLRRGDRIATLASLSLTPLRIDRVTEVRRRAAQIDVQGQAVVFATSPCAVLPGDLPERLALAVLDVAGAAPQVGRLVRSGQRVVILGAGGKSGILCAAEARRRGGRTATIIGVESHPVAAEELRALDLCDEVLVLDARDPIAVRRAVLQASGGHEADVTFSCVNVPDAEMSAVLVTRDRGIAYFFAMSTSFTKAALGAEGVGKDVDLFIGNGYAEGHAEHSLDMMRTLPAVRSLFEKRYV